MNLRDYCKQREYSTVIGTTYSFHPIFFEKVILPDLKFGYGGEVLVIGDGEQLTQSISKYRSQLRKVGNSFIIEPIYMRGAFHPKLLLKIGRGGARLLLGSGNMTAGGWGGNNELFSEWELNKDNPISSFVVRKIVDSLKAYARSPLSLHILNRALEYNWLLNNNEELDDGIIITEPDKPLITKLMNRWRGKEFHTLRLYTGSTDSNGAFIEWCHKEYGIKKCIIAANEENISFEHSKLKNLPVDISFALLDDNKMMHAKTYIFEGNDGISVVTGSANCSRAAWLMAPNKGGNVEAIIVYDSVDRDQLSDLLSKFPDTVTNIDGIKLYDNTKSSDPIDINPYKVVSLSLDKFNNDLSLELSDPLPDKYYLEIEICNKIHLIKPIDKDRLIWKMYLDEWPQKTNNTLFAEIRIKDGNDVIKSFHHWINDINQIQSSSSNSRILNAFNTLSNSASDSEYTKALKAVRYIVSILDDPLSFQDPMANKTSNSKEKSDNGNLKPVDRDNMYKSILELNSSIEKLRLTGGQINTSISLSGIMRLFFSFQDEIQDTDIDNDEEDLYNKDDSAKGKRDAKKRKENKPKKQKVDARFQKKLQKEIEDYFIRLRSEDFRQNCTAAQLVQKATFTLAIAVFGIQNGWIDNEIAEKWVMSTIDILFSMEIDNNFGILDHVKNRYEMNNNIEIFNQACGDGTLWIALLTAIDKVEWTGNNGYFHRAYSIQSILNHQSLISSTDVGRWKLLVTNHTFQQTTDWINKRLAISNALEKIEKQLITKFNFYISEQLDNEHMLDDIIYGKIPRWGTVLDERIGISNSKNKMNIYLHKDGGIKSTYLSHGYFVNLRIASEKDDKLSKLISNFKSL